MANLRCSFMVGRAPAQASDSRRFFDPKRIASCSSISAAAAAVAHTRASSTTPPGTWSTDIERLREHLGIERWLVFGGSWGSTLALAYAQTHPQRVTELVLRGIFLLRRRRFEWFYQEGANAVFPDPWEHYVARHSAGRALGSCCRVLSAAYRQRSAGGTRCCASLVDLGSGHQLPAREPGEYARWSEDAFATAVARIECHYFVNRGFFQHEDQLLRNAAAIRHVPAVIVQGRYDVVCPMMSAWELHRAWPEAEFHVVPDAGHSAIEPGILHQLVSATDRFALSRQPR